MPVQPTYPGVYIEEIPSGVHTITGVATSITAFVGRSLSGPVNEPITINSFGDFERFFGGLQSDCPMSYAVRDFYNNGGSQAIIVRLYGLSASATPASGSTPASGDTPASGGTSKGGSTPATGGTTAVTTPGSGDGAARLTLGPLTLQAASPGGWGNKLQGLVNNDGISQDVADRYGLTKDELFNLVIQYGSDGSIERIPNISVNDTAGERRIDRVLTQVSQFVRIPLNTDNNPALPTKRPDPMKFVQASGGVDSAKLQIVDYMGSEELKTGLYALEKADLFNLLCIPPDDRAGDTDPTVYAQAMEMCANRRAMLIIDPPAAWSANKAMAANTAAKNLSSALPLSGTQARNVALYFPRVIEADPLRGGQLDTFVPCGIIAGVISRTDRDRGLWKAPAGLDAALNGILGLEVNLNDAENGMLNPLGINCLRAFPINGMVVWGARTLRGADQLADEYKYVPVRRMALFIEESLYRGTQWAVFEPNDEPLWAQLRLNIGAFMQNLFRQGAFQGQTPKDAYLVKCDKETTTQNDINLGIVNILVAFAPLKPAEFVVIQLQQLAGQIQV
jgi:uncharacterized protein